MRIARTQRGSSLVEMALVISVFMVLIFAIIEFTFIVSTWSRMVDATRSGLRYAIVNSPILTNSGSASDADTIDEFLFGDPNYPTVPSLANCTPPEVVAETTCARSDAGDCPAIYSEVDKWLRGPMVSNDYTVTVQYRCSDGGTTQRPTNIADITVTVANVNHNTFVLHGLMNLISGGFPSLFTFDYSMTRTGEDIETVVDGT